MGDHKPTMNRQLSTQPSTAGARSITGLAGIQITAPDDLALEPHVKAAMGGLVARWPKEQMSLPTLAVWNTHLREIEPAILLQAITEIVGQKTFFPSIEEVKKFARFISNEINGKNRYYRLGDREAAARQSEQREFVERCTNATKAFIVQCREARHE
jgi:hypothetical protein